MPEAIDGVMADWRGWLEELAARGGDAAPVPAGAPAPPDLHSLLGQLIALRQEVNLQTKATRAQQEQNAEALRELERALEMLRAPARSPAPATDNEAQLRPLLKTLIDVGDALILARREFLRGRQAMTVAPEPPAEKPPPVSWWDRLLGRRPGPVTANHSSGRDRTAPLLESLVTGYTMSVQRVERALMQCDLERIPCVGEPFDPERMEVVEVVDDPARTAGEVVEEVRPGYLWRGRVFRYAQVSVARPGERK